VEKPSHFHQKEKSLSKLAPQSGDTRACLDSHYQTSSIALLLQSWLVEVRLPETPSGYFALKRLAQFFQ
jgi:hypothetical protein